MDWCHKSNRIATCSHDCNAYVLAFKDGSWVPDIVSPLNIKTHKQAPMSSLQNVESISNLTSSLNFARMTPAEVVPFRSQSQARSRLLGMLAVAIPRSFTCFSTPFHSARWTSRDSLFQEQASCSDRSSQGLNALPCAFDGRPVETSLQSEAPARRCLSATQMAKMVGGELP